MSRSDPKAELQRYLRSVREAVLWKLDGLSEYDVRRPMTSTGTNLLGLVKHLAGVEIGYFGPTFDRPFPNTPSWFTADAEPNVDMWATAEESPGDLIGLYRQVWEHADATIAELPLDALGRVPWWPAEHAEVTLHRILVHVISETNRHAGHLDIIRELIDGAAGLRPDNDNLPTAESTWWTQYRARLERVAREAGGLS